MENKERNKKMGKNSNRIHRGFHMERWYLVNLVLILYDILAVNFSYFFGLWIRFDCRYSAIPEKYLNAFLAFAPIYTVLSILVFWILRLYKSIWKFASYSELFRAIAAAGITFVIHTVGITVLYQRMPISYYLFGAIVQFALVLGVRFAYRFVLLLRGKRAQNEESEPGSRVMLIGAGAAGQMILRDIKKSEMTNDRVCCIIDDDPNKWKRYIDNVPIVGGRDDILYNVKKYHIDKFSSPFPVQRPRRSATS